MRFRIDVNTLDGKLTYERDSPDEVLAVAESAQESLGVTITDTQGSVMYSPVDFSKRFAH
jgi:hypothetical protein